MRKNLNQILILIVVVMKIKSSDCVWNSELNKIQDSVIRKYQSCLDYCSQLFSQYPQRAYYNLTSQNCEPLRKCVSISDIYDYQTNKCYKYENKTIQTQNYIPDTLTQYKIVSNNLQICVNGNTRYQVSNNMFFCECQMLWQNSGNLDMNGIPFKCDKVVEQLKRYFYQDLELNQRGQIIKYGPYSSKQLRIVINELKQLEKQQIYQYIYNQTQPIFYSVENFTKTEDLIKGKEYIYLILIIGVILLILGITYFDYQKYQILVTKQILKERIINVILKDVQIINENNIN